MWEAGGKAMLQMRKNTKAKIGALLASGLTLASVLGFVYRGAPTTGAGTQPAQAVTAPLAQPRTADQISQAQPPSAQPKPKVNSRTHVS
jgi:hypothetical protein